jgi:hypothetical protein
MKTPKTLKGYLKLLLAISKDSSEDLKGVTYEDCRFINLIRAEIQNILGEDKYKTMERNNLKWKG